MNWTSSEETLNGVPCLRTTYKLWPEGPYELNAFGELGQIGEYNASKLVVVIYGREHERRRIIPRADARKWAAKLLVPADPLQQLKLAENFRLNLHYLEGQGSETSAFQPAGRG